MENNSVSHRNNGFPAGLRVLVVDDDQVWLKLLEKMLIKCSYDVTTCCLARDALEMLRKKKDGFDIVISDVNMPDMDGFKLLEHVGLEMNLPVIMMSVDGETSRVMKGVQHGACDYLLKPVRMKELQNIWQHVIRKRMYKTRNSDGHESNDDEDKIRNGLDELEDSHLVTGGDPISAKKRKENENHEHDNQDSNDPSVAKKARIVWSVDLHQKFLDALNQIGFDNKVGPKKILDVMNVPWLTRENVASHLQKYRLYLSRLQKQNEPKASFATSKQSDITSKDPSTSFDLQDSMTKQQNQVTTCSFIQEMDPKIHDDDMNTIFSFLPTTKPKTSVTGDTPHTQKLNATSRTGFPNTSGSTRLDANYTSCKATVWDEEIPLLQFLQQPKEQDVHGKTYPPLSNPHLQIQANFPLYASVDPGTSLGKRDKFNSSNIHSMGIEDSNSFASNECPTTSSTDLFSIQALEDTSTPKVFRDEFTNNSLPNMINHSLDQKIVTSLGSFKPTLNSNIEESGKTLMSSEEDPQFQALQDYDCVRNFSLNNLELLDLPLMELVTEFPGYSYDELQEEIFCFFLKINGDGSCS